MLSEDLRVRELKCSDICEIARLKSEQGDTSGQWQERFEWQFSNNPARSARRPLGWIIETGGKKIDGHQMAMPQRVKILDQEQSVSFSADTYVAPSLRGQGLGRKLFETFFKAQEGGLALTTTANPASEYLWLRRLGAIPIGDLNKSFLFIFRSGRIIQEILGKRISQPWIRTFPGWIIKCIYDALRRSALPDIPGSITCERIRPDDPELDEIWEQHRGDYQITTIRDRVYRIWRYSGVPGSKPSLWLVRDSGNGAGAWFSLRVAVRGRSQLKVSELLDIFGPSSQPAFQRHVLSCAVHESSKTGADVMEVKGLHQSWRSNLLPLGFVTRTLPSNPFLCKSMSSLDEAILKETLNWHLCCSDGDAGV